MKKYLVLFCGIALVAGTAAAADNIQNTKHNFATAGATSGAWANGEICAPCHVPHGGTQSVAPLWAHTLTTGQTYQVYTSTTLNATGQDPDGATHGRTRLCLSCHDNSVALASFVGATATGAAATNTISDEFSGSNAILGTNLTNDHPVAFTYDTALSTADPDLRNPATTPGVQALLENYAAGSGTMECSSCHDPHGKGFDYLMRQTNAASALCLTCHSK